MVYIDFHQSVDASAQPTLYIAGFGNRDDAERAATELRTFFTGTEAAEISIEPAGSRSPWKRPLLGLVSASGFAYIVVVVVHRRRRRQAGVDARN
jgi:hypothetical protein